MNLFRQKNHSTDKKTRQLRDVRNGDKIKINISGFVADAIVLNNSPEDKKMFLRIFYGNGKYGEHIERYDDHTFINFNVLNNIQDNLQIVKSINIK